ncbi:MAG: hypothetical protein LBI69_04100 [Puniceicoccales bacterium]|nr:hypothetical protein [Puniceicoccales bacterium]
MGELVQCDCCGALATVYLAQVINGTTTCLHLCAKCAKKRGILDESGMPVKDLLTACGIEYKKNHKQIGSAQTCPKCGCTLNHFRATKGVGCSHCYEAFSFNIAEWIGIRQYKGEPPPWFLDKMKPQQKVLQGQKRKKPFTVTERIRMLDANLKLALAEERYEDAAQLRDKIAHCKRGKNSPCISKKVLENGNKKHRE